MSAAQYIGRIGGLAVTLGLGAALTTGTGIAWAGPSEAAGSQQATTTHDRKAERSSALTGAAKRIRAARDDADSKEADSPKPRGVNQGAAFTRAQEISKAAKDFGAAVDRAVDGVTEKITDRLNDAAKGTVLIRTPDAEPADGQQSAEPEVVIPSPAPEEVRTAQSVPRPDGSSGPSTIRAVPANRLPSLHTSNADIQTAVQAAVDGIARRASSATETIAAHPATFVGSAITDIRAAISPTTTSFTMKAIEPAVEAPKTPQLVSSVLAAVGLAPLVGNSPLAPTPPPALWALLAWARREFERTITGSSQGVSATGIPGNASVATQSEALEVTPTAAVVNALPTSLPSTPVGWVTGVNNGQLNGETVPQTNNTTGFNIWGTDLGIMWDNEQPGDLHFVNVAFGDTFSQAGMTGDWRSNVLLLSVDHDLSDGLLFVPTGPTFQFIPGSPAGVLGLAGSEVTVIPTAGIAANGNQYVNYMSVKSWDTPGFWTTNYSGIAQFYPGPNGGSWALVPSTIRSAGWFRSTTPFVPGDQNFQQGAYVTAPQADPESGVTYVYNFGTPAGRSGSAYVSRVAEADITDLSKYEYWDGNTWVANKPAAATPIFGDSTSSTGPFGWFIDLANDPTFFGGYLGGLVGAKTGGNVSEMLVQYNEYLGKYVVLYGDGNNNIQMRTADAPEGPWSDPIELASSADYPGLYAPMIHPWSGTSELPDENNLYWNMSIWGDYNVVMMQTDLTQLHDALPSGSSVVNT